MRVPTIKGTSPTANGSANPGPSVNGVDGGRDPSTGRFTAGNHHGIGNPFARRMAALKWQFLEAITPDLMRTFVCDLARLAGKGDMEAAHLFLTYGLGGPPPPVDPDGLDAHELLLLRQINLGTLEAGGKCLDGAAAVAAVKALMRAGLRKALATGKLADLLVRADVQQALTEAGLADVVDEANTLRGRLK
jgi:hypothetical protein